MPRRFLVFVLLLLAGCSRRESRPPIIIISIDTLRSDHLPAYGYRGVTTPNLDALAADSLVYRNAWSHCPLTLPSHLSILTGLLPPDHGVRDNAGYRFDGAAHPTLAALLHDRGYHCAAAISAYVLRGSTGVSAGFDEYDDAIGMVDGAPLGALQRAGNVTEAIAERWIAQHEEEPFFYFLHLYEPHAPYTPVAPFDTRYANKYDGEIASVDATVGTLIGFLKKQGVYDRAIVVLLSDHGEGLLDHGEQEHGVFLYREALQVPLFIKLPHAAKRGPVNEPAALTDVAPTLLAAAGANTPAAMQGKDLVSAQAPATPRTFYAETLYPRIHLGWSELRAATRGEWHLIDAPHAELFRWTADRGEKRNLVAEERRTFSELREAIHERGSAFVAPDRIDPEEAKKLAALGYVSAGADDATNLPDPKEHIADLESLKHVASLEAAGDARGAIAAQERLLAANPRWSDLRDQLGAAYDRIGDHSSAARVYESGIRLTPRLAPQFAVSAGWSLLALRRLDEAAAHAALGASAGAAGAHLLLGEIALAKNDAAHADQEAQLAETNAGDRAQGLFLAARVATARHDYPKTLQLLAAEERQRAAAGGSLPERYHYVLADALAHTGKMSDAEREFQSELAKDPHDVQAWADLALLEMIGGNREKARGLLVGMARANPRADVYRFGVATLEKWGDREEATRWRSRGWVSP
jgi:arylsulfatase A-like enzyme